MKEYSGNHNILLFSLYKCFSWYTWKWTKTIPTPWDEPEIITFVTLLYCHFNDYSRLSNFYYYAIGTVLTLYSYRDSTQLSNRFLARRLVRSIYRDKQLMRAMVAFCFKVVILLWKCTLEIIIFRCSLCTYKCLLVDKTWKWTKTIPTSRGELGIITFVTLLLHFDWLYNE